MQGLLKYLKSVAKLPIINTLKYEKIFPQAGLVSLMIYMPKEFPSYSIH